MFLRIWNYIRGYVIIEVWGFSAERFMNLAVHKGVYIWDIHRDGAKVTMKVSVKGFRLLRPCAKKTKCKIKIKEKVGTPFLAFRYRKRSIFLFGVALFIFALYFMSSFVWLVEVTGNERILTKDVLSFCQDYGLKTGSWKYNIDTIDLRKKMMSNFPDISWVRVEIKGTKALIRLAEILPKQEILDKSVPCDIIASKDGLITGIITSAGTPLVRQNDVVRTGDILVSGELTVKEDETGTVKRYVHAISEVRAKLYYNINFFVPKNYSKKIYTDKEKNHYSVVIFEKHFSLIKPSILYTNYDKITEREQLSFGENYPLPIILVVEKYREYQLEEQTRSLEQMEELADSVLTGRIIREFDFDSDIIDKKLEFTETENGLEVSAQVTTIERIDTTKAIDNVEGGGITKDAGTERITDTQSNN